ncbi:GFA family protein [Ovoidimarina sediminis]|uniref:GFA family protein n=1 Tax=Ovoidimarina sediminis TaxID=3079856 RepID=UPI002908FB4D|nr:GFA family protein [Rhodophyticola sp. MJ-SS7]MDU8942371.1 GFA family protein [Rhodophyticola sp. MJ-SS7]
MASTEGGCLCGAIRYRLAETPTEFGACHCGMCRKSSGGVGLAMEVPDGGLTFTEGEDRIASFQSSDWAERAFCPVCGSGLYWRMTAEGPAKGLTILNAGTLDDMNGMAFTHEIYVDNQPDCYAFAGERKRMTEAEVIEMVSGGGEH